MTHTASATFLEVLTPPAYLSTHKDHIYLVGRTDAALVEVIVNTVRRYELPVRDSIFHKHIFFGFGLNEISIRPINNDSAGVESPVIYIEMLSSPYSTGRLEKMYPPYQFHGAGEEAMCGDCHVNLSGQAGGVPEGAICIGCHIDFKGRSLLHSKLKKEDCFTCHNQLTNQVHPLSSDPVQNPCYKCHRDKVQQFNQEFIHGPVAGGSCAVCHDPHGSPFSHSLINVEEVLCFSCHEFGHEMKELPIQHKPFLEGKCGVCHDPHATSNRWILAKSSEKLCFECHSPGEGNFKNHTHPYNVKPKRRTTSSVELSEFGTLECISCHNPHASQSEHLLRCVQDNTCQGCHTEKI